MSFDRHPSKAHTAKIVYQLSTLISDARRAVGWTMRDLAEHLGVNTSSISRMEASERDGTIRVETLCRALDVMGFRLRLGCEPIGGSTDRG